MFLPSPKISTSYTALMRRFHYLVRVFVFSSAFAAEVRDIGVPAGWTTESVRQEIRPKFTYDPKGGRSGTGSFIIETGQRDGLDGFWTRSFPVEGGKYYSFHGY